MHPLSVIALVVRSSFACRPAVEHQCRFGVGEGAPWDKDIDVREDASAGCAEPGTKVGRALEQNDGHATAGERSVDVSDFPAHRVGLSSTERLCGEQMCARRLGHLTQQPALVERLGHAG